MKHSLSRSQLLKWFKALSEGCESIKYETRSGRPTSKRISVEKVSALVQSVRMIASELNMNYTTQELALRKSCAKCSQKPVKQGNRKDVSFSGTDTK